MNSDTDKGKKILEVAIRLFSSNGFESVKISDITDEIGIGKGTFYLYYKNKRDLLINCFRQLAATVDELERSRQVQDETDFCIRMKNRFIGFSDHYSQMTGILHLLRNECTTSDPTISEKAKLAYNAIILPLQNDIIETIRKQEIRDINAELAAYVIVGMGESLSFKIGLDKSCKKDAIELFYTVIQSLFKAKPNANVITKQPEKADCVITDQQSKSTDVSEVLFDGKTFLTGLVGDAEIHIDINKVRSISVSSTDLNCSITLLMKDGQQATLAVANTTTVTGQIAFGMLRIPLAKIRVMEFRD